MFSSHAPQFLFQTRDANFERFGNDPVFLPPVFQRPRRSTRMTQRMGGVSIDGTKPTNSTPGFLPRIFATPMRLGKHVKQHQIDQNFTHTVRRQERP